MLSHEQCFDTISTQTEVIAAAASGRLDTNVPTCPEWTLGRLAGHVSSAHAWANATVSTRSQTVVNPRDLPRPPQDETVIEFLRRGAQQLVETLGQADPATPVWTWYPPDQSAAFWFRRMAHETAVHAYDAQVAAGTPRPLDQSVALDGIDEALHVIVPMRQPSLSGSYHLHCTDAPASPEAAEGEWLVRFDGAGGSTVVREHAKADVAIRASASDLLLFLLGRLPSSSVEVLGDEAMAKAWTEQVHF